MPIYANRRGAAAEAPKEPGLECRRCGCHHFRVIYTRPMPDGRIQRRRECRHCGWRVTTVERAVGGGSSP